MFILLGFIVVVFIFYHAAGEAKQSKFLWVIFAIVLFTLLGMLVPFYNGTLHTSHSNRYRLALRRYRKNNFKRGIYADYYRCIVFYSR